MKMKYMYANVHDASTISDSVKVPWFYLLNAKAYIDYSYKSDDFIGLI